MTRNELPKGRDKSGPYMTRNELRPLYFTPIMPFITYDYKKHRGSVI
jgi:hypothetical protein